MGNLTRMQRSTGLTSAYAYDAADRVTAITHATPEVEAGPPAPSPSPVPYAATGGTASKCTGVAGYLGARAASTSKAPLCEKAAEYLDGRALPVPDNPVPDGGVLSYRYAYDADGNVTSASRSIASGPNKVVAAGKAATSPAVSVKKSTITYGYDPLGRLTASKTSAGEKNTYGYDAAGNRTSWTRSGAKDGNFAQRAEFNDANQLTRSETSAAGRGVSAGIASYSYDAAGNRVNQSVGGVATQYAYNPAGQTTRVSRDGRTTSYGYDGLGRNTSVTDQTRYGSSLTHTSFNGLEPTQSTDSRSGTTTLVRDALGNLAEHVTQDGKATWDLLDRLGSTIAGATGGSITQLSSYEDWGTQRFESGGWSAAENFTGEQSDPTEGLNHYYARAYDPGAGVWTSMDPWRGLVTQPQSLHRYGYAWNNPSSNVDIDGNLCARVNPGSDALPVGCGAPPVQARDNVTDRSKPPVAPQRPRDEEDTPKATGPNSKNDVTDSHGCKPGTQWYTNSYTNGKCVDTQVLQEASRRARFFTECDKYCSEAWSTFFSVVLDGLGVAGATVECIKSRGAQCGLEAEAAASFLYSLGEWGEAERNYWQNILDQVNRR